MVASSMAKTRPRVSRAREGLDISGRLMRAANQTRDGVEKSLLVVERSFPKRATANLGVQLVQLVRGELEKG
jgi:hypothetical protein